MKLHNFIWMTDGYDQTLFINNKQTMIATRNNL